VYTCNLFEDAVTIAVYTEQNSEFWMNWIGCGRKRRNLRHCLWIWGTFHGFAGLLISP